MDRPLLLLVEDDPAQARLFCDELTDAGCQVVTMHSGLAALEFVRGQIPDLIVLDLHLPEIDGLEMLQRLLDISRKTPIILHTAYASYRDDLRSWPAVRYIVKSSDMEELREAVAAVLMPPSAPRQ